MKKKISIWLTLLLMAVSVVATLAAVRLSAPRAVYGPEEKLAEALYVIDRYFIGESDPDALADSAVDAMVQSLGDRWSYYMTAEELAERDKLRRIYIDSVKASLTGQLDNTYIVYPDGTKKKVGKKD